MESQLASRGHLSPDAVDGAFDAETTASIEAFQTDAGLVIDGRVGPQTAAAIGLSYNKGDS